MKNQVGKWTARAVALLSPFVVALTLGASAAKAADHGGYAGPVTRLIVRQGGTWTGAAAIAVSSVILGLLLVGVGYMVISGWADQRSGLAAVPAGNASSSTDEEERRRAA